MKRFLKRLTVIAIMVSALILLSRQELHAQNVVQGMPVYIGGQGYQTLGDAFENVKDQETIILQEDITLSSNTPLENDVHVVLDLNGHTISCTYSPGFGVVQKAGDLTIKNGTMTTVNAEGAYGVFAAAGDVKETIFENLNIFNFKGNGLALNFRSATSKAVLRNVAITSNLGGAFETYGTLDVYDSTFTQTGDYNWNSSIGAASNNGTVNFHSGTFTSENFGIYVYNSGGTINVFGGDFTAGKSVLQADKKENVFSRINVRGGTFHGEVDGNQSGEINIEGGEFSNEVPVSYIASGYEQLQNEKGSYVISPVLKSILLSDTDIILTENKERTLTANLQPAESLRSVQWTSSDEKVATISSEGVVKALKAGTAVLTAKAGDVSAECKLTVIKPESVGAQIPAFNPQEPVSEVTTGVHDAQAEKVLEDTLHHILNNTENAHTDKKTSEAVQEALKNQKNVTIVPVITEADQNDEAVKKDSELIAAEINNLINNGTTQASVAKYLNLEVVLKADNEVLGNITSLKDQLQFSVVIPDTLRKEGRSFYVIRVHNGKSEILSTTMKGNQLIFSTDRFSTYALVHTDEVKEEPVLPDVKKHVVSFVGNDGQVLKVEYVQNGKSATAPQAPEIEGYRFLKWDKDFTNVTGDMTVYAVYEKKPADNKGKGTTPPQTGDPANIAMYVIAAVLALGGLTALFSGKRKVK